MKKSFVTGKYVSDEDYYHEEKDYEDSLKAQDRKLLSSTCRPHKVRVRPRPVTVVVDDPLPYEDSNFDTGISGDFQQCKTFKKEEV